VRRGEAGREGDGEEDEAEGRMSRCELHAERMREAAEWIERYRDVWEKRLDSLERYVEEKKKERDKASAPQILEFTRGV
jgi:branched-subunit amino acid aminotransferase/4-amino-4-deoxychorismate lyase